MATISFGEVRSAAQRARVRSQTVYTKTAGAVLEESVEMAERQRISGVKFDVFLSHSSGDAELVLGIKQLLEERGVTVYVDWINDPKLDRSNVTPASADVIRTRMRSCKSMFFLDTDGSISSKWMPWECGYFDAFSGSGGVPKVAILPIRDSAMHDYAGREFLGLYYYITLENSDKGVPSIWVREGQFSYASYEAWMLNIRPSRR